MIGSRAAWMSAASSMAARVLALLGSTGQNTGSLTGAMVAGGLDPVSHSDGRRSLYCLSILEGMVTILSSRSYSRPRVRPLKSSSTVASLLVLARSSRPSALVVLVSSLDHTIRLPVVIMCGGEPISRIVEVPVGYSPEHVLWAHGQCVHPRPVPASGALILNPTTRGPSPRCVVGSGRHECCNQYRGDRGQGGRRTELA